MRCLERTVTAVRNGMADRDREWTAGLPSGQWGRGAGACDQGMDSWALQQEGGGRGAGKGSAGQSGQQVLDGMRWLGRERDMVRGEAQPAESRLNLMATSGEWVSLSVLQSLICELGE